MADGIAQPGRQVVTDQIRVVRRQRKLTLEQLARATGLHKGYLSRIERGRIPSIGALLKIADALGVQVSQLFGEQVDPSAITVVRREDRKSFAGTGEGQGHSYESLLLGNDQCGMEAFIIYASEDKGESATHAGHEMIFVLKGSAEIAFVDRSVQLGEGDCMHFPGSLRHRINGGDGSAVLVVVARPT